MGSAAGLGSTMPIMMILIIGVIAYMIYKKRKADKEANPLLSTRKNKDEVWRTIKQFLSDFKGEYGKEIIDSYVVKRNHVDMIDPNGSDLYKINKNAELKIRKMQFDKAKKLAKESNLPEPVKPAVRQLFVVVFQTRNAKTRVVDPTRCFECEVVVSKPTKQNRDGKRSIVIHRECDLDREMEWIAPVRCAELAKQREMDARIAKQKEQEALRQKKKLVRVERRAKRNAK